MTQSRICRATVDALKPYGKIGSVGYCYGGSCCWLVATRIGVAASSCYYGGQIAMFKDEKPQNPVMMHFGEKDHGIPMADVETHPQSPPRGTGVRLSGWPWFQL